MHLLISTPLSIQGEPSADLWGAECSSFQNPALHTWSTDLSCLALPAHSLHAQLSSPNQHLPHFTWVPLVTQTADLAGEASRGNRSPPFSPFPSLRGLCLLLLGVPCLENNVSCVVSLFICLFISGGKVSLVNLSCLDVKDGLLNILFNCINEPWK